VAALSRSTRAFDGSGTGVDRRAGITRAMCLHFISAAHDRTASVPEAIAVHRAVQAVRALAPGARAGAEQHLSQRAAQGDRIAFGALIVLNRPRILRRVGAQLPVRAEVEDIVQASCLYAYRAIEGFRGDSAFLTWVLRIADRAAWRACHQERRLAAFELACDYPIGIADAPEGELAARETAIALIGVLETLPETLRAALLMREVDGASYVDIADAQECPVGTVRSRLARARAVVSAHIGMQL